MFWPPQRLNLASATDYETNISTFSPYVEFLPTNSDIELPSLNFLKQRSEQQRRSEIHGIQLFDSCNGILLCRTLTNAFYPVKAVYVCNPLTREKVTIPHPQRRSNLVHYALLSDSKDIGLYRFRVACLYERQSKEIAGTELLIYSSQTGVWEAQEGRLPELWDYSDKCSKVFFNGSLFWDCFKDHILVCHMSVPDKSRNCYELIEALNTPPERCLVKFDEKLICYCNKYGVWCLRDSETAKKKLYWDLFESCTYFNNLKEDFSRLCRKRKLNLRRWHSSSCFDIIDFDHRSDTIIFVVRESIFSYNVKKRWFEFLVGEHRSTRRKKALRNFSIHGRVATYTHNLVKIQTRKEVEAGKEKKGGKKTKEGEEKVLSSLHAVKDDLDNWASLMEKNANMVKPRGRRRR